MKVEDSLALHKKFIYNKYCTRKKLGTADGQRKAYNQGTRASKDSVM